MSIFAKSCAHLVPSLFFRDLDDVAAVEPVATLGGELPTDSLTKEEKKKQKKKQQKVAFCNVCSLELSCHFSTWQYLFVFLFI